MLWPKKLNSGKIVKPKKMFYPNFGHFTVTFEPETLKDN